MFADVEYFAMDFFSICNDCCREAGVIDCRGFATPACKYFGGATLSSKASAGRLYGRLKIH
jgi:hypothetical protein